MYCLTYLLAVDIKVAELTMGRESGTEVSLLNLLSHVLDVSHGTLLLSRGRGSRTALALGVGASSLPARCLLGRGVCSGSGRGSRSLNSRSSGGRSSGRGSSRSGSTALVGSGRRSGLGQRHNRSGTSGSGSTASPGHGLGRSSGLGWGSLNLGDGSGSLGRGRGLVSLLDSFLSHLGLDLLDSVLSGSVNLGIGHGLSVVAVGGRLLGGLGLLLCNRSGYGDGFSDGFSGNCISSRLDSLRGGSVDRGLLLVVLIDESEYVVENKVSGGLLGENESLDELSRLSSLVRGLANDLDNNVVKGGLGIDVGDADLAVLELEFLDALLDGLREKR